MDNSLFSQLFRLHASPISLNQFTLEVLAGVLRSDQTLLDQFVNTVLKIEGQYFIIETQKFYKNIQIDMVFSNAQILCFMKSQIEAFETYGQLESYQMILKEQPSRLKAYLRYCSQYENKKKIEAVPFVSFFWSDIYDFLKSTAVENPLVNAFLYFLREQKMNQITELKAKDLIAISHIHETLNKMDLCLDAITTEFTELFGYPTIGSPQRHEERLRDLGSFKQYHLTKNPILHGGSGEWGWSDVRICFTYHDKPSQLVVWYWCGRTHNQYELLKKLAKKHQHIFIDCTGFSIEERPNWLIIAAKKPITDFDVEPKPLQAIQTWLTQTLHIFRKFADKTPELHWNLPK